jgi:hypothetical protein
VGRSTGSSAGLAPFRIFAIMRLRVDIGRSFPGRTP